MAGTKADQCLPHFALLPHAGMGHVTPFCRLAAALATRGCTVSFIAAQPTVSNAESLAISRLVDSFPNEIQCLNLPLVDLDLSKLPPSPDPFFVRFMAIRQSAHLLPPVLAAASGPITALIIDIVSASTFIPVARQLSLPAYILFTSSASLLSLVAHIPTYLATHNTIGDIEIPGLQMLPKASVTPALHDPNHPFTGQFVENGRALGKADGILVNTFQELEAEAISALNAGVVAADMPPVIAVGPFCSVSFSKSTCPVLLWLDQQPDQSVVYVSFGSRTAMAEEQIQELGDGLERSGQRFLWVVKTKIVDREEEEEYVERVKGKGLVVNGWVEQEEILRHRAVGGFVSHCGWNSVTEAAMAGKRVLAWPRIGDQRVNGEVVRRSGLGVWMEGWFWEAEEGVVSGDEIAKTAKAMMEDEGLRKSAARVGMEANKAVSAGGSSVQAWQKFINRK